MIVELTLQGIQAEPWYKGMKPMIQKVVDKVPCNQYYYYKGKKCFIIKYNAVPLSEKFEDCTVNIHVMELEPMFRVKEGIIWSELKNYASD